MKEIYVYYDFLLHDIIIFENIENLIKCIKSDSNNSLEDEELLYFAEPDDFELIRELSSISSIEDKGIVELMKECNQVDIVGIDIETNDMNRYYTIYKKEIQIY